MDISPFTVSFLDDRGQDAMHLLDREQQRMEDREILDQARRENRILLVHDLDFSDLVAAGGTDLPSVVVFRLRNMRPSWGNQRLEQVVRRHASVLEEGAIFSVTETQIR